MSYFSDIANKLFPKKETNTVKSEPFLREELKRSSSDKIAYSFWAQSTEKEQVIAFISEQLNITENQNAALFRTIDSGTTKGFMLRYLDKTESLHFQHLFDYFKDQIKELQYTVYTSDVRTFDRAEFVERIERHYLKPSWRVLNTKAVNDSGKMNQLYGNITIELVKHNDQPQYIKFVCQHYVDSKFSIPLPYSNLMHHICRQ